MAVLCTNAMPATNYTLDSWKDFAANTTRLSFIAGNSRSCDTIPCRHWYALPNERWLGDFEELHLRTPVLMIGNTYDSATPLDSARRLADRMGENARLLEQRSYGHCSGSAFSSCTNKVTLDYLLEGHSPRGRHNLRGRRSRFWRLLSPAQTTVCKDESRFITDGNTPSVYAGNQSQATSCRETGRNHVGSS